ncbi:ornithine cyclodeaminase [Pseudorhodoferax aquiterrae]|uniref:Ornithine cyclodeaminase n=1 Tax=Pseudorhodoferax aquiterrae TaxID=747304 RepID=A0ABQ3FZ86_9BURK|nr:ornithine cyclodeaminase family protein [Pseudorhodoferax aquiterrae]GHC76285.1 ornithine cyclodeaminase [Pseudorhodoferax aquiterrae]
MRGEARLRLLDGPTVAALLEPQAVRAAVEQAFALHSRGEGRTFPVVREPLEQGVFGIKSGAVPRQALLGYKAAGFWPGNRGQGGEPHQATIVLHDPATGRPLSVIDGNAITTARTAAAGAIGLQRLARPDSRTLCLFGTGVQARAHLAEALRVLPALEQVRYCTHRGQPDAAFEAMFADRCALQFAPDADAAVAASDVVVTATPASGPLFGLDAVRPGTHVNAVGADTRGKRELPEGLLARALLVVDDRTQARALGEAQWAPDVPCTEIGALPALPRAPDAITVFDLTGLALQDLAVARLVLARAEAQGLGLDIAWPW